METKRADQSAQMTGPISIGRGGPGVARIDLVNRQVASLEEAGDLDQALKVAQEYRSSVEKTHGSDHHYHVHSLNVLAKLHAKKGNLTQAEEGFRKAWTICRKSCGPDDPQTVEQTIALADVYQTALNTTPQYSTTLKYDAAKDSWFGSTEVQRPFPRFPPAATPHAPPAVGASAASGTFPGGTDREDRRLSVIQLRQKLTRQSPHEVQQTVVPVLQRAIVKTKNDSERLRYIRAVGQIGPAAMDVVPVLIKRLEEATDVDERKMLLQALGRVGPAAEEAVPTLAAWAKGPCPVCRREAVEALLQCGPAGRKAINQLNTRRFFSDQGVPTLVGDQIREVDSRVGVLDTYRLFTPFTLHRAQRALRVFARDQRTEIFVETLARPLPNEVELANRAKLLGTRGVYVVLAKEPRTLQIHATDSFRQDGFTRQKQEQLGKVLLPLLEKDNYDQALTLLIEQLTDVELDEEK